MLKKKKLASDIFINLLAITIRTVALNIVVYPIYARTFTAEEYGVILTVIGLINLLFSVLGNCLNNTRLVLNKYLADRNKNGDYNPIVLIVSLLGCLASIVFYSFFEIKTFPSQALVAVTVLLGIARAYFVVAYRLVLNYIAQLKTNIFVAIGYICGVLLINRLDLWPLPIFLGEGIALVYTIKHTTLVNEPFKFTDNRRIVISAYTDLILSSLIGNILAYFDRFLINPVLGPASVAVFSVAVFWGKIVTPVIAPSANVMLSYLCQKDSVITLKNYILLFVVTIVPLALFGFVGIWLAPLVTGLLYPTLIKEATPYILYASAGSLIQSTTSLLMPVLLSMCSTRSLLKLDVFYFVVYVAVSYLGAMSDGLMGFCIAICIIGVFKTILYFGYGYYTLSRKTT